MSTDHPQGSQERKEVSRSARVHRPKQNRSPIGNGSIRNALLVAGGLTLGGSIPTAIQGCAQESESENIGRTSQALNAAAKWNVPTKPAWSDGLVGAGIHVTRSGSNIKILSGSARPGGSGAGDIWVVGSNDSGATWTSPSLTPVGYSGVGTAINTAAGEAAPVVFNGGTKIFISRSNKIQQCDWNDGLNQGGNCASIGSNINVGGHIVFPYAVENGKLYYGDQNPVQNDIFSTPIGPLPLAVGTPVSSLNTGVDEGSLTFDSTGTFGILSTLGQPGNLGGFDLYAFDWNSGTQTATNITNLNAIGGGSYTSYNSVTDQGIAFIDSLGDNWHIDNGDIYWSTKIGGGGDGGADAGTDGGGGDGGGGEGGGDAGPCFAQVTQNPGNVTIQNCTDTQLNAQIHGPSTVKIGNKTFKVTDGTGTMDFSQPNYVNLSEGIEYEGEEPASEADKIISNESGITLGFEGTKTRRTYPAALNPNKASKVFNIVAYTTVDGTQRAYDQLCVPESNSVSHCNPVDFTAPGSADKGAIPAGVTMFRELSTGQLADDPSKFNIIPPVEEPPEGCTCASVQHNTANGVDMILLAAGVAGILRRKRK